MSDNSLKVTISGDGSQLSKELQKSVAEIKASVEQMKAPFDSLQGTIGKFVGGFAAFETILGGGKLFSGAIDGAISFQKEIAGLQRMMGGTKDSASVTALAIKSIFGDVDTYESGISKLSKTLNTNEKAITSLGVRTRDGVGSFRAMTDLMPEVIQALSQYKEGTDRDTASQAIFGRSFKDMLVYAKMTPEVLEEARAAQEKYGLQADRDSAIALAYRKAMEQVDQSLLAIKIRVANELMPSLIKMGNWFVGVAPDAINLIVNAIKNLNDLLGNFVVQVTAAGIALDMALLPAITRALPLIRSFVLSLAIAGPVQGTIAGLQALGVAIKGLISPWLLAGAAIFGAAYGLSTWAQSYSKAASEAAQRQSDLAKSGVETNRQFYEQSQLAGELESKLNKTTKGTKEYKQIHDDLKKTLESMIRVYPELEGWLQKENGQYVNLTKTLNDFNASQIKQLEIKASTEETLAKIAKDNKDDALSSNWLTYGIVYKGVAENAEKEQHAHEETAKALKAQIDALKGVKDLSQGTKTYPGTSNLNKSNLSNFEQAEAEARLRITKEELAAGHDRVDVEAKMIEWIKANLNNYKLSADEKKRLNIQLANSEAKLEEDKATRDKRNAEEQRAASAKQAQEWMTGENEKIEISDADNQRLFELGKITELQLIDLQLDNLKKRKENEDAYFAHLDNLYADDSKKYAENQINKERANTKYQLELKSVTNKKEDAQNLTTFTGGVNNFIIQSQRSLQNWKSNVIDKILNGVESSFSDFFQSIFKQGMTGAQKWNALWQGMAKATVGALSEMAAKYVALHAAQLLQTAFGKTSEAAMTEENAVKVASTQALTAAQLDLASAEMFAAYGWIPFVGLAMAEGAIGVMEGFMLAANATNAGIAATGMAVGGLVTHRQLTMLGEGNEPELVAPKSSFLDFVSGLVGFVSNIAFNSAKGDRINARYSEMSSSYAKGASKITGGSGNGPQFNNSVIIASPEAEKYFDGLVYNSNLRNGRFTG
jgi:hypothetical protein